MTVHEMAEKLSLQTICEPDQPDAGVKELAEKKDVNLYATPEHSFAVGAKVAALL